MGNERHILMTCKTVAVVGLSPDSHKPSHRVASYLKDQGYTIIGVNPKESAILGEPCYACLSDIPEKIDVVEIFRKAEDVLPVVDEAIRIQAKAVWMQEGIVNHEAAAKAREAGMDVVMDKCMLKEHARLKH